MVLSVFMRTFDMIFVIRICEVLDSGKTKRTNVLSKRDQKALNIGFYCLPLQKLFSVIILDGKPLELAFRLLSGGDCNSRNVGKCRNLYCVFRSTRSGTLVECCFPAFTTHKADHFPLGLLSETERRQNRAECAVVFCW